jgi:hypothetical protein
VNLWIGSWVVRNRLRFVEAPHAAFENFGCSHLRSNTRFHVAKKIPAVDKSATVLVSQAC